MQLLLSGSTLVLACSEDSSSLHAVALLTKTAARTNLPLPSIALRSGTSGKVNRCYRIATQAIHTDQCCVLEDQLSRNELNKQKV
mmetsp:Transcript_21873/g.43010  ORF Transcript_21873/g.43010 Transcript_21873/m.43010 type:complete len:85 (-) Transcript_21873:242-496(-)